MEKQHFVLFHDHTTGMELYRKLKEQGIQTMIVPTPRSLSKCCGISLLVMEQDLFEIRGCIDANRIKIKDIAEIPAERG